MKSILSLLALTLCISANAQYLTEQKSHYSLNTGVNLFGSSVEFEKYPNFEANLQAETMLSKRIGLALAVNYTLLYDKRRGYYSFYWEHFPTDYNATITSTSHLVDIPLKFNWYFYKNDEKAIYVNLSVGPSLHFLLSSSTDFEHDNGSTRNSKRKSEIDNLIVDPALYFGFDFTKVFLQKEEKSYFFKSSIYAMSHFDEYEGGSQFGLNIGVGMAL